MHPADCPATTIMWQNSYTRFSSLLVSGSMFQLSPTVVMFKGTQMNGSRIRTACLSRKQCIVQFVHSHCIHYLYMCTHAAVENTNHLLPPPPPPPPHPPGIPPMTILEENVQMEQHAGAISACTSWYGQVRSASQLQRDSMLYIYPKIIDIEW